MISAFTRYIGFFLRSDLILPTVLIIAYIIFLVLARGVIPTPEELINTFASLYSKYGYEIIFLAALLETLVSVNLFVPGQVAMAMGVIFARSGQTELSLVILTASAGSICGYLLDYVLGSYGFADIIKKAGYKNLLDQAQKQLKRFGKRGLIFGFIHSNVGSFLSLVAGAANVSWKIFIPIAIVATFFWTTLWGILIYIFGEIILMIISKYGFLLFIFVIAGMVLNMFWKEETIKKK